MNNNSPSSNRERNHKKKHHHHNNNNNNNNDNNIQHNDNNNNHHHHHSFHSQSQSPLLNHHPHSPTLSYIPQQPPPTNSPTFSMLSSNEISNFRDSLDGMPMLNSSVDYGSNITGEPYFINEESFESVEDPKAITDYELLESFSDLSREISDSKESIQRATKRMIDNVHLHEEFFAIILKRIKKAPPKRRVALFYLVDSISQVSKTKRLDNYIMIAERYLSDIVGMMIHDSSDPKERKKAYQIVDKVITLWKDRDIFPLPLLQSVRLLLEQHMHDIPPIIGDNQNTSEVLKSIENFRRESKRIRHEAVLRPINDLPDAEFEEHWNRATGVSLFPYEDEKIANEDNIKGNYSGSPFPTPQHNASISPRSPHFYTRTPSPQLLPQMHLVDPNYSQLQMGSYPQHIPLNLSGPNHLQPLQAYHTLNPLAPPSPTTQHNNTLHLAPPEPQYHQYQQTLSNSQTYTYTQQASFTSPSPPQIQLSTSNFHFQQFSYNPPPELSPSFEPSYTPPNLQFYNSTNNNNNNNNNSNSNNNNNNNNNNTTSYQPNNSNPSPYQPTAYEYPTQTNYGNINISTTQTQTQYQPSYNSPQFSLHYQTAINYNNAIQQQQQQQPSLLVSPPSPIVVRHPWEQVEVEKQNQNQYQPEYDYGYSYNYG